MSSPFTPMIYKFANARYDPQQIRPAYILHAADANSKYLFSEYDDESGAKQIAVHVGGISGTLIRLRTDIRYDVHKLRFVLTIFGDSILNSVEIEPDGSPKLAAVVYDNWQTVLVHGNVDDFNIDYPHQDCARVTYKEVYAPWFKTEIITACNGFTSAVESKLSDDDVVAAKNRLVEVVDFIVGNVSSYADGPPVPQLYITAFQRLRKEYDEYLQTGFDYRQEKIFGWRFHVLVHGLLDNVGIQMGPMTYIHEGVI